MNESSLIVRPLASTEEYTTYYRLTNAAFSDEPSEEAAQHSLQRALESPEFRPERVRGAFRDGQLLGGYVIHDRTLRMGTARLSLGAIGGVVTAPEMRKQGVARELMWDAIDFARQHKHTLLLLDGIPNFYFRFGYTDMFDVTVVEINRSAILASPSVGFSVRLATPDDAPAILELYLRHYGPYTGSFERSLEQQRYIIQTDRRPLLVVHSIEGAIEGYLRHGLDADERAEGQEVAATSWEALLALLRYHAELFDAITAPSALQYLLAPGALLTHWMVDKLELSSPIDLHSPTLEWSVRSITHHHRFTGWMACLVDYPLLMDALLPELQARWQRALAYWNGEITLSVDGQSRTLSLNNGEIGWAEAPSEVVRIDLSAQAFVQLLFGYRPLVHLADISTLPGEARKAIDVLFPMDHTWIPRTDWF